MNNRFTWYEWTIDSRSYVNNRLTWHKWRNLACDWPGLDSAVLSTAAPFLWMANYRWPYPPVRISLDARIRPGYATVWRNFEFHSQPFNTLGHRIIMQRRGGILRLAATEQYFFNGFLSYRQPFLHHQTLRHFYTLTESDIGISRQTRTAPQSQNLKAYLLMFIDRWCPNQITLKELLVPIKVPFREASWRPLSRPSLFSLEWR